MRVDGSVYTDSNIITVVMGTISSPPTGLEAIEETLTDVTFSWQVPTFTGFVTPEMLTYEILIVDVETGAEERFESSEARLSIGTLQLRQEYVVHLFAKNEFGTSEPLVELYTKRCIEKAPGAPKELERTLLSIIFEWAPVESRCNSGNLTYSFFQLSSESQLTYTLFTNLTENEVEVTYLIEKIQYQFAVSVTNDYGESILSEPVSVVYFLPPSTPKGLREMVGSRGSDSLAL